MKNLTKGIWEHLKTRKKYNVLLLKYEMTKEDLEKKTVELNTERRIHLKKQEIWEQRLKEQTDEIIKLKKRKKNVSNKSEKKQNKKD